METKTAEYQADKLEFIKNPVVAEFLDLSSNIDFTESEREQSIITHIQKFLMEMGKCYAFVARQQHIRTELDDYFIDLVFHNYILKCFVLIDLKTTKITHQDVGQMDMYIWMYDELIQELCPDGVEYKTLGEASYFYIAKRFVRDEYKRI